MGCLVMSELLLIVMCGEGGVLGHLWVEARDSAYGA